MQTEQSIVIFKYECLTEYAIDVGNNQENYSFCQKGIIISECYVKYWNSIDSIENSKLLEKFS